MKPYNVLSLSSLAAAAGALLAPGLVHANPPILQARCAVDSLSTPEAIARLEWARRCGSVLNVVSPVAPKLGPDQIYDTGLVTANGQRQMEYFETLDAWGTNGYSGDSGGVNQMFTQNQFRPGPITASTADNGFQKWTQPTVLPRPNYPTFGNSLDINAAAQLLPSGDPNDCKLYDAGHNVAPLFYVNGYCTASCYTPDMSIRFADGEHGILDAMTALRTGVTTLDPSSSLDKIKLTTDDVASYTRELHDATHVIYDIRTASGGALRVTDKHPIIVGDGRVVEAASIKVGDQLIHADGARDAVASVAKTEYVGKVYNIKPVATDLVSNILVAQGFLVGSSRYQNEDVDYINRIILGRSLPADVVPR